MSCIYNGVCSSLVALFLWQQVTHLAAVIVLWYFTQYIQLKSEVYIHLGWSH